MEGNITYPIILRNGNELNQFQNMIYEWLDEDVCIHLVYKSHLKNCLSTTFGRDISDGKDLHSFGPSIIHPEIRKRR